MFTLIMIDVNIERDVKIMDIGKCLKNDGMDQEEMEHVRGSRTKINDKFNENVLNRLRFENVLYYSCRHCEMLKIILKFESGI